VVRDIIFPDSKAADIVRYQVKHVDVLAGKCKYVSHEKTYPQYESDTHVTVRFEGTKIHLETLDMLSWLTYKVGTWKP